MARRIETTVIGRNCPACGAPVTTHRNLNTRAMTVAHPEPIKLDCDAALLGLVPRGWSYGGSQGT
jgi:hypothetical protein